MGTFSALLQDYRDIQANGCFYVYKVLQISEDGKRRGNWETPLYAIDASRSNPIYSRSNTVQPPSVKVRVYTYYQ